MDNEMNIILQNLPEDIKQDISNYKSYKIASIATGLPDFSLDKVAGYMGGRAAARRAKWKPVLEGLAALKGL